VIFSTLAEILAYAFSGVLFKKLGSKISLALTLTISALGGYAIWLLGFEQSSFFTVLVMMCKFGISGTYNIQLCSLAEVFPTTFLATGFGIGHFFSVIFQISTPFIAAMEEPVPVIFFASLCTVATVLSLMLRPLSTIGGKGRSEKALA